MIFNNPGIVAQVFNFLIDENYKSVKQDKYITVLKFFPTVEVRVQCFVTLPLTQIPIVLVSAFQPCPIPVPTLVPLAPLFLCSSLIGKN